MIVLGIILLILGYVLGLGILTTIGWIVIAVGVILLILGALDRPLVGGRRWWY